jgi:hypothetical protein
VGAGAGVKISSRISDNSYVKPRFGDKRRSLENFLRVFAPTAEELVVVADRCGEATVRMVEEAHREVVGGAGEMPAGMIHRTDIGHGAGSWRYTASLASRLADSEVVYFLEDDYLHLPGSRALLLEGLGVAHYVTLYDHPDTYVNHDQGGNPCVTGGGEVTRVVRTASTHWKYTISTTMTFATTAGVLRQDLSVWDSRTRGKHPEDFPAFVDLHRKGRVLAVCLPGRATHCTPEFPGPYVDWDKV